MKIQTAEKLAAMGFEFQVERVIDEEHIMYRFVTSWATPEMHFGEALEAASLQTLNEGIMTKDLCGLAEGITPTAVDSEGFIKAIRERLEAKLA